MIAGLRSMEMYVAAAAVAGGGETLELVRRPGYSIFTPASFTTFAHWASSLLI